MAKKILDQSIEVLLNSQVILYPTDTVWGIGCDATSIDAVAKIFKLKNRVESKSLVVLVSSIEMLHTYVDAVPQKAIDIISTTKKPTTIIYSNPKGLAANAIALDNTIAIRIPSHDYCLDIINKLGKPIISTSANISGESTPKSFSEISLPILEGVDYVVNLEQDIITDKSSTILKLVGNDIEVIRA
jgi:L-threonylcarbamoyladenylate synthase